VLEVPSELISIEDDASENLDEENLDGTCDDIFHEPSFDMKKINALTKSNSLSFPRGVVNQMLKPADHVLGYSKMHEDRNRRGSITGSE